MYVLCCKHCRLKNIISTDTLPQKVDGQYVQDDADAHLKSNGMIWFVLPQNCVYLKCTVYIHDLLVAWNRRLRHPPLHC